MTTQPNPNPLDPGKDWVRWTVLFVCFAYILTPLVASAIAMVVIR
jgi:hypothetical protein